MPQVYPSPSPGRHLTGAVQDHKTLTGNLIEIVIDGKVVGRCQSLSRRQTFGTEPVMELGTMMPAEVIPLRWSCSVTVTKYKLRESAFDGLSIAYSEDVLKKNLCNIVVRDRASGKTIETYVGCVQSDDSGDYPAGRPCNVNATFMCMDYVQGDGSATTAGGIAGNTLSAFGVTIVT